jgi:hypothetical protein
MLLASRLCHHVIATVAIMMAVMLTSTNAQAANATEIARERGVLVNFYTSTGSRLSWDVTNASSSHCSWPGILCISKFVSRISVGSRSLTGTIPEALGTLSRLQWLILCVNYFTSSIPLSLAAVPLEHLNVSDNGLTGSLPNEFGAAWAATIDLIDVDDNRLQGTLPASYSQWKTINTFSVARNQLEGTLPEAYSRWGKNISMFDVEGNFKLNGTLPTTYSNWTKLLSFRVGNNSFRGTIPEDYKAWSVLQTFAIHNNSISGTIPDALGLSWGRNLVSFIVERNQLQGTLPNSIGRWSKMQSFYVQRNNLSGTLPRTMSNWSQIFSMQLQENAFNGTLPPEFGDESSGLRTSLWYFNLFSNQLSGTIPFSWSRFTELRSLFLHNNRLTGTLPPEFGSLPKINFFNVALNQLHGKLPESWSSLRNVFMMSFQDNPRLEGVVPASWDAMFQHFTPMKLLLICRTRLCGYMLPSLQPAGFVCVPPSILDMTDYAAMFTVASYQQSVECQAREPIATVTIPRKNPPQMPTVHAAGLGPSAQGTATTAAAWASLVVPVGMAAAGSIARLQTSSSVARLRALCTSASSAPQLSSAEVVDGDDDGEEPLIVDLVQSPLQLSISSFEAHAKVVGGIIGNTLLALGTIGVLFLCRMLRTKLNNHKETPSTSSPPHVFARALYRIVDTLGSDTFPTTAATPYMLYVVPCMAMSIELLADATSSPDEQANPIPSGIIAILAWLLWMMYPIVVVIVLLRARPWPVRTKQQTNRRHQQRTGGRRAARGRYGLTWDRIRYRLMESFMPTEQWCAPAKRNRAVHEQADTFIARYGAFFTPYKSSRRFYFVVEMMSALAAGVVEGVTVAIASRATDPSATCRAADWGGALITSIALVTFLLSLWWRPWTVPIEGVVAGFVGTLSVLSEVLVLSREAVGGEVVGVIASMTEIVWIGVSCVVACVMEVTGDGGDAASRSSKYVLESTMVKAAREETPANPRLQRPPPPPMVQVGCNNARGYDRAASSTTDEALRHLIQLACLGYMDH